MIIVLKIFELKDEWFSFRLDTKSLPLGGNSRKSTFNYMRQESIKLYGNVIVLKVALMIFELIGQIKLK